MSLRAESSGTQIPCCVRAERNEHHAPSGLQNLKHYCPAACVTAFIGHYRRGVFATPWSLVLGILMLCRWSLPGAHEHQQANLQQILLQWRGGAQHTLPRAATFVAAAPQYRLVCPPHLNRTAPATIVTAYFSLPSKHTHEEYLGWMSQLLQLDAAMVIYVDVGFTEVIRSLRQHRRSATVIVPTTLAAFKSMQVGYDFWRAQTSIMCSQWAAKMPKWPPALQAVWAEKSSFLLEALRANCFNSNHFFWVDIGCYRPGDGRQRTQV